MIDFEYYVEKFNGCIIPDERHFNKYVPKAKVVVDMFVINSQAKELLLIEEINSKYKNAVCAVCEVICEQNAVDCKVSSESVGNHSVSYVNRSSKELKSEQYATVRMYLTGTGLMYGGM